MARKPRILVISSANMDLRMQLCKVPEAGQTVKEEKYEYQPGGKGANAAVAAAKLGADCVFCTRLGNDQNGRTLRDLYKTVGIDTRFISTDAQSSTGLAVVMVEESGQNRIVVYPGVNSSISEEDADDALSCIPDALFLQMEISQDAVLYAANRAYAKGIPVFIDAGPATADFPLEKLPPLEVFSPNETETEICTGLCPNTIQNCMKACLALAKRVKAKYYVLKLGDRGAYVYDGLYYHFVGAYEINAVDTTACGDAFSAALTLELLRSDDIKRAVEFANIVGALTALRPGAANSVPSEERVRRFIAKNELDFKL